MFADIEWLLTELCVAGMSGVPISRLVLTKRRSHLSHRAALNAAFRCTTGEDTGAGTSGNFLEIETSASSIE